MTPKGSSGEIKELLDNPSIFPFQHAHVSAEHIVSISSNLDLLRYGLDDEIIILRKGVKV